MKRNKLLVLLLLTLFISGCGSVPAGDKKISGEIKTKSVFGEVVTSGIIDDANLPVQQGVTETTQEEFKASYTAVAKSENQVLYIDMAKGWFALKDIKSGHIWYSVPNSFLNDTVTKGQSRMAVRSDVTVGYIFKQDEASAKSVLSANSHVECVRSQTVRVRKIDYGVRIDYDFSGIGLLIPVELKLFENYLEARVITAEIKTGADYKKYKKAEGADEKTLSKIKETILVDLSLYPMLGAGTSGENGYLVIPDGSGALMDFIPALQKQEEYKAMVYGEEPSLVPKSKPTKTQPVRLPVFGSVREGAAIMGVITDGDGAASIKAVKNHSEGFYASVGSVINFRMSSRSFLYENYYDTRSEIMKLSQDANAVNAFAVRFYTLSDSRADYTGMAEQYRKFLQNDREMSVSQPDHALMLQLYGSAQIDASFAGIPYKRGLNLTTFKQAAKITDFLMSAGVDKITVKLAGWTNSGLTNEKAVKNAIPLSSLGGQNAFKEMSEYFSKKGIALFPQVDFIKYKSGGRGISGNGDAAKTLFGHVALQYDYMPSVFVKKLSSDPVRLLNPQKLFWLSERFSEGYKKHGIKNIALETIGEYIYSSFGASKEVYRSVVPAAYHRIMEDLLEDGYSIAVDGGNAYAAAIASVIYNPPASSSGYDIFSRDIPFYSLVFRGVKQLTSQPMIWAASPETALLKAAETGNSLLFDGMYAESDVLTYTEYNHLYSTNYKLWAKRAVLMYAEYSELLKEIGGSTVESHEMLAYGVYQTVYSNGVAVIVNYNEADFESVPGRSYKRVI